MAGNKVYEEPQMAVLKMYGDVVTLSGDTDKKPVIPASPGAEG